MFFLNKKINFITADLKLKNVKFENISVLLKYN